MRAPGGDGARDAGTDGGRWTEDEEPAGKLGNWETSKMGKMALVVARNGRL